MPLASVVTGRVVDDTGEPVVGAQVRVLALRRVGESIAAMAAPGVRVRTTDDRGEFRLYGLLPGRYFLSASIGADIGTPGRTEGFAPVYFPSTPDITAAVELSPQVGADITNVHLVLTRSPTYRVTGVALDASGQPATGVLVATSQRSGGPMTELRRIPVAADGAFVVPNVPPGDYVIQAMKLPGPLAAVSGLAPQGPMPPSVNPFTPTDIQFGMAYVTVVDRDPPPLIEPEGAPFRCGIGACRVHRPRDGGGRGEPRA
jgi:hypothetical protein